MGGVLLRLARLFVGYVIGSPLTTRFGELLESMSCMNIGVYAPRSELPIVWTCNVSLRFLGLSDEPSRPLLRPVALSATGKNSYQYPPAG